MPADRKIATISLNHNIQTLRGGKAMTYHVNTPVSLKEQVHGTSLYITELMVTLKSEDHFIGKITLEDGLKANEEVHSWEARRQNGSGWKVTGDGAVLSSGNRINSPETYPFTLSNASNDYIKAFIAKWVTANGASLQHSKRDMQPRPVADRASPAFRSVAPIPQPQPSPQPQLKASAPSSTVQTVNGMELVEVLLAEVMPNPKQPRVEFFESDQESMKESMEQDDQQQLIVVTPIKGVPGKKWKLIDGERRYRGALAAGLTKLMAIKRVYASEAEELWASFVMNMHRRGHTPYEWMRGVAQAKAAGKTIDEICTGTGYKRTLITRFLQLQKLAPELKELMRMTVPPERRLRMHVASMLVRAPDHAEQVRIWNIAKQERTPGMRQLKVEELLAPHVDAGGGARIRKRKPSDNAERIFRALHAAETTVAFMSKLTKADLNALVSYTGTANDGKDLVRRIKRVADGWSRFQDGVEKTALKAAVAA